MLKHFLFFLLLLALQSPAGAVAQTRAFPPQLLGSWMRTVSTEDDVSGTRETQESVRTLQAGGLLRETVTYTEAVTTPEGEAVELVMKGSVEGNWFVEAGDLIVGYKTKTLAVELSDLRFPLHDEALWPQLRQAWYARNRNAMRNYLSTFRNALRIYYRRNSGRALRDVEVRGATLTATMGDETVSFTRLPE